MKCENVVDKQKISDENLKTTGRNSQLFVESNGRSKEESAGENRQKPFMYLKTELRLPDVSPTKSTNRPIIDFLDTYDNLHLAKTLRK